MAMLAAQPRAFPTRLNRPNEDIRFGARTGIPWLPVGLLLFDPVSQCYILDPTEDQSNIYGGHPGYRFLGEHPGLGPRTWQTLGRSQYQVPDPRFPETTDLNGFLRQPTSVWPTPVEDITVSGERRSWDLDTLAIHGVGPLESINMLRTDPGPGTIESYPGISTGEMSSEQVRSPSTDATETQRDRAIPHHEDSMEIQNASADLDLDLDQTGHPYVPQTLFTDSYSPPLSDPSPGGISFTSDSELPPWEPAKSSLKRKRTRSSTPSVVQGLPPYHRNSRSSSHQEAQLEAVAVQCSDVKTDATITRPRRKRYLDAGQKRHAQLVRKKRACSDCRKAKKTCIHVLPEDKGLADEESRRAAFARGEGQSPWTIEAINDRKVESDALNLQTLSLTSFTPSTT